MQRVLIIHVDQFQHLLALDGMIEHYFECPTTPCTRNREFEAAQWLSTVIKEFKGEDA